MSLMRGPGARLRSRKFLCDGTREIPQNLLGPRWCEGSLLSPSYPSVPPTLVVENWKIASRVYFCILIRTLISFLYLYICVICLLYPRYCYSEIARVRTLSKPAFQTNNGMKKHSTLALPSDENAATTCGFFRDIDIVRRW